ncbi:glycosyl hydrolase family 95 catalytic domain-containing protein [Parachryseolinea silvisoli]|uniref:glycosyl hydrolase family 95 catalytic domain-containing protein n=1 Tax=Parachryseolinea silvisoli TaxID=2873601 RepID=UPI002265E032|nr:hypothetical protein [Parachryseolinea silvisoli]MCD9018879.1 hypothetical protein [Parachryseolinea silvisoli]
MKMIKIFLPFLFAAIISQNVLSQPGMLKVDYASLVSRADLVYNKPVRRSEEGMPVGNGTLGGLVWTTPTAFHTQLNRVDVFANNSASNAFYERHTDYCGGVAFADIDFIQDQETFRGGPFRQHLSCYDGTVTLTGAGVSLKTLTWHAQDVMAVQVEDTRSNPMPVVTSLRALRWPVTKKGNHSALSTVKVIGNKIVLLQEFREDTYYCGTVVVAEISGRAANAGLANESTARITAAPSNSTFTVYMASAASFDPAEDLVAAAIRKLDDSKAKGFDGLLTANQAWWHDFWQKSFVSLHSADGEADLVEKHYTYYLYVMATSSRGAYPPKFNGMLWTTGGDDRKWGNLYWGANQSCLYNALLPTNHLELMDPMFRMYTSMSESCAQAARQQWGSKGIYIPETVAFDGMAPLPEDIAAEMQALYLLRKPWSERSKAFTDYAYLKMPFLSRWNWKKDDGWKNGQWSTSDKGGGAFGHVSHIFSRGAKIAYQYWLKYEYTQDGDWLRKEAYPMLKGVAEFYRNFPNVKKEADGKYHIHHINDNESVWGGHDTVEEIAAMMGIFPVAIKASEILNTDPELRTLWKEFSSNLAPLPLTTAYPESADKPVTWVKSMPPVIHGEGNKLPDANTMPVWFFDLCNLESDPKMRDIANTTYDAGFPEGIDANTRVNVLSKLPVAGVILGRTDATRYLIPNQIRTAEVEVMPNRMDLREGFQATSVQRLGRAAEALLYALCQAVPSGPAQDPVIHVFPAWPAEWDAQYSLLCRGGFVVTASQRQGQIEFVEIRSQAGTTCRTRNPWPGKSVTVYRNGKKWKSLKGELLSFPTRKNERYILLTQNGKIPKL